MAYEEILDDEVGEFFKFSMIGDTLAGRFVSSAPSTGQYGGINYTINTTQGMKTVTAKSQLAAKLAKAALKKGDKVQIKYESNKDIGKESPMKCFKVLVERVGAAPSQPTAQAQAKPAPAPKAPDLDDIPY